MPIIKLRKTKRKSDCRSYIKEPFSEQGYPVGFRIQTKLITFNEYFSGDSPDIHLTGQDIHGDSILLDLYHHIYYDRPILKRLHALPEENAGKKIPHFWVKGKFYWDDRLHILRNYDKTIVYFDDKPICQEKKP